MDVVKSKKTKLINKKQRNMIIVFGIFLLFGVIALQGPAPDTVKLSEIIIGTVKKGNLDIIVEGYGRLVSNKKQLITTATRATVKEVVLKPGAPVTSDSIIIEMESQELTQQVENARQELKQSEASLRQLKITNKREYLLENAALAEIVARHKAVKLKRVAEEKLVNNGTVSQLSFQETSLDEQQLEQRINIFTKRLQQLTDVHREMIDIQVEQIKQNRGELENAQEKADRLSVRAGIDGVLQRLPVELGQSLSPGQEIALIGSVSELVALIKVPQNKVQQISIGQKVIIDTRIDKIDGKVSRIDPIVKDNTVNVEVLLLGSFSASTRPQQNVDGVIIVKSLINVTYIERPANARSNSEVSLYQVDENLNNAELVKIKFGHQSGRFIEVISGAKDEEKYILSDMSHLPETTKKILIES